MVILAGAMVGSMFGFRDAQFMLAEGSTSAIPRLAGATITLNSFKDTYDTTTGAPLDYASDVTVTQDGQVASPSTCSGSTSRCATGASRSTRPSSGRPRS